MAETSYNEEYSNGQYNYEEQYTNDQSYQKNGEEYVAADHNNYRYSTDNYNPNILSWATALYAYQAQSEEEISFNENDVIGILEHQEDGWSRGELNGVQGLFPTSYVQDYNAESTDPNASDHGQNNMQDDEAAKRRKEKR